MKKIITYYIALWIISTILISGIILSYRQKKIKEIEYNFFNTVKTITKQRVDAGLRVLSSIYYLEVKNEKEKFLLTDFIIKKFNLNTNFNYKNIYVEFTKDKKLDKNFIYLKDVINENKIVYIYEKKDKIKEKIYNLIPTLFDAFRFGKKGYIFVYDDKGNCYYHYDKSLIGQNRWNLKRNGIYVLRLIIKKAKENPNGVYVEYLAYNPKGTPTKKISYVVYYPPLNLILGSGIYLEDLDKQIKNLNNDLLNMFYEAELTMSIILLIVFYLLRRKIT